MLATLSADDRNVTGVWPVALGAGFVLLALCGVAVALPLGHLATLMAIHIFAMNVAAPTLAVVLALTGYAGARRALLWPIAFGQLALLGVWHLPSVHQAAMHAPALHGLLLVALFLAATLFWLALLTAGGNDRWRAIFVLLVTGKIACLIGALLTFAPRPLYMMHGDAGFGIADQQMAGLLMIAACPLSYVVAGVVFAGQWLADLEKPETVAAARPSIW